MMHSRPSITIDAGILAVPSINCTKDQACQYVDTLLDWKKQLDEQWVTICMSEGASEALVDDELFPIREQLAKLFDAHRIDAYDVNTVVKITDRLLTATPSFESFYKVSNILSEYLETDPDIIRLETCDSLRSNLARCVIFIAILRKYCSQFFGRHSLILREAPRQVIQVRALVYDLEHTRDDIPTLPCPPDFFEGDVLVCADLSGLIESLGEDAILVGASDDSEVKLAIRIALFKHSVHQENVTNWDNAPIPRIGVKFRESCQKCCCSQSSSLPQKVLRSIVEMAIGKNLSDVHPLRICQGGSSRQRLRGHDKDQRRDIDREFHLHYWKCKDGTIELASVVHHNDFSIPE
ncbi:MAG: hypothetical protein HRT36_02075 [Alphaproteobacteria bacterium]|nr:hypothetical protein [Alphaproteobacteria bacterium]